MLYLKKTLELESFPIAFMMLNVAQSDQKSEVNVETGFETRQDE